MATQPQGGDAFGWSDVLRGIFNTGQRTFETWADAELGAEAPLANEQQLFATAQEDSQSPAMATGTNAFRFHTFVMVLLGGVAVWWLLRS